jgi:hypothetical protein
MAIRDLIKSIPELEQLVNLIRTEIQQAQRPPEEVIFDDVSLREMLKVSKRTTANWRERGFITFSKLGGKIFYRLSDVLMLIKQNEIPAVRTTLKIS